MIAGVAHERQPRTVLHLRTVTGRGGGPEKTLLASPRFIGEGYQLRLAYIRPEHDELYDLPARAEKAGATLIDIPERNGIDPRTWFRLVQEIKTSRPAILHPHDYKTNLLGILLARRFRLPVVTTLHGYGLGGGRLDWYYRVERWALRRMDHVVAVSQELLEYAQGIGVSGNRSTLVKNAIDVDQFSRRQGVAAAKLRLGIDSSRLVVGAVGRLTEEKGFDRLIRALDRLISEGHDLELYILGEGPLHGELSQLISGLGRSDRLHLVGYVANTMDWYHAMDVFALSSLKEGLPNVLLEAMALEVPVVATRIAEVPRVVTDGVSGLLAAPDDVDSLVESVRRLASDSELRRRLGRSGRQAVVENYSFAVRMQKIREIYDAVLHKSGK